MCQSATMIVESATELEPLNWSEPIMPRVPKPLS